MRSSTHGSASRSSRTGRTTSGIRWQYPGWLVSAAMDYRLAAMVLVTGGAGFIGSHVVDELLERGDAVRIVDALLPAAHRERPGYLDPRAEFVEGDLRDPDTIAAALEGVDAVCHQSAMVGLGVDLADIAGYVSHNDLATAVLLRALAARSFTGT